MSAYGNPQPYANLELERDALLGRIKVARSIATTHSRAKTRASWKAVLDELLDHLNEVDARAASAAMDGEP